MKLDRVLGLTVTSNASLATAPSTGNLVLLIVDKSTPCLCIGNLCWLRVSDSESPPVTAPRVALQHPLCSQQFCPNSTCVQTCVRDSAKCEVFVWGQSAVRCILVSCQLAAQCRALLRQPPPTCWKYSKLFQCSSTTIGPSVCL